jgi:hypothetical protein
MGRADELIAAGYEAGLASIPKIRSLIGPEITQISQIAF